ncbi:MAG TPA: pyridoxal phosphate-dependent aminotransferase [Candidatus Odoribacter faecigallinarum]|uniref:Pyridoxal phosphate-dependent aminotransferase n=1 Tax=Candidatus Odoribacter faecigallinarum TaxID=2838706 RepID=A0A9D1UYA6_9BACT|nr:pyridoxal phosphate-dependent aminotransferase [Candidatus Odoribacter faecigallinarum]
MLQISDKGKAVPASPIRKLVPYANKAKERGIRVFHLNIGQPDIATPEIALEVVRRLQISVIEYTDSAGNHTLRSALAGYYQRLGIHITEDNILITTGGSEAILFAFMSTLNEGDEIIIPEPFYANYTAFAVMVGAKIKTVTATIENGFALPPISEFEKLITPRTKGIVIINPNNPTGYLYSKEELEALAGIVKKHDLYLYSDEVYRRYCYDGAQHFSVMNLKGIEQNTILFDSMSKRYSECGIRVGAIITRNQDILAASLKFGMARLCPPALGQIAAEASLETSDEYFHNVHEEYVRRRNFMVEALNKIPGVVCPMPKGAFYSIVKLPVDDAEKFAQWLLEEFDYNGQTVMLAPASGFYHTPGLGKNEVRVAYVLKTSDLQKAIEVLAEALKVYPGRTE